MQGASLAFPGRWQRRVAIVLLLIGLSSWSQPFLSQTLASRPDCHAALVAMSETGKILAAFASTLWAGPRGFILQEWEKKGAVAAVSLPAIVRGVQSVCLRLAAELLSAEGLRSFFRLRALWTPLLVFFLAGRRCSRLSRVFILAAAAVLALSASPREMVGFGGETGEKEVREAGAGGGWRPGQDLRSRRLV